MGCADATIIVWSRPARGVNGETLRNLWKGTGRGAKRQPRSQRHPTTIRGEHPIGASAHQRRRETHQSVHPLYPLGQGHQSRVTPRFRGN